MGVLRSLRRHPDAKKRNLRQVWISYLHKCDSDALVTPELGQKLRRQSFQASLCKSCGAGISDPKDSRPTTQIGYYSITAVGYAVVR